MKGPLQLLFIHSSIWEHISWSCSKNYLLTYKIIIIIMPIIISYYWAYYIIIIILLYHSFIILILKSPSSLSLLLSLLLSSLLPQNLLRILPWDLGSPLSLLLLSLLLLNHYYYYYHELPQILLRILPSLSSPLSWSLSPRPPLCSWCRTPRSWWHWKAGWEEIEENIID